MVVRENKPTGAVSRGATTSRTFSRAGGLRSYQEQFNQPVPTTQQPVVSQPSQDFRERLRERLAALERRKAYLKGQRYSRDNARAIRDLTRQQNSINAVLANESFNPVENWNDAKKYVMVLSPSKEYEDVKRSASKIYRGEDWKKKRESAQEVLQEDRQRERILRKSGLTSEEWAQMNRESKAKVTAQYESGALSSTKERTEKPRQILKPKGNVEIYAGRTPEGKILTKVVPRKDVTYKQFVNPETGAVVRGTSLFVQQKKEGYELAQRQALAKELNASGKASDYFPATSETTTPPETKSSVVSTGNTPLLTPSGREDYEKGLLASGNVSVAPTTTTTTFKTDFKVPTANEPKVGGEIGLQKELIGKGNIPKSAVFGAPVGSFVWKLEGFSGQAFKGSVESVKYAYENPTDLAAYGVISGAAGAVAGPGAAIAAPIIVQESISGITGQPGIVQSAIEQPAYTAGSVLPYAVVGAGVKGVSLTLKPKVAAYAESKVLSQMKDVETAGNILIEDQTRGTVFKSTPVEYDVFGRTYKVTDLSSGTFGQSEAGIITQRQAQNLRVVDLIGDKVENPVVGSERYQFLIESKGEAKAKGLSSVDYAGGKAGDFELVSRTTETKVEYVDKNVKPTIEQSVEIGKMQTVLETDTATKSLGESATFKDGNVYKTEFEIESTQPEAISYRQQRDVQAVRKLFFEEKAGGELKPAGEWYGSLGKEYPRRQPYAPENFAWELQGAGDVTKQPVTFKTTTTTKKYSIPQDTSVNPLNEPSTIDALGTSGSPLTDAQIRQFRDVLEIKKKPQPVTTSEGAEIVIEEPRTVSVVESQLSPTTEVNVAKAKAIGTLEGERFSVGAEKVKGLVLSESLVLSGKEQSAKSSKSFVVSGTKPLTSEKPSEERKTSDVSKIKLLNIPVSDVSQEATPLSKGKAGLRMENVTKLSNEQKLGQEPIAVTTTTTTTTPTFSTRTGRGVTTKTPVFPVVFLKGLKEAPRKEGGFVVEVRRRGEFKPVSKPVGILEAFKIGRSKVEGSAAASFRIKPTSGADSFLIERAAGSALPSTIYTRSKRDTGIFVQRREKRITSFGEKREIRPVGGLFGKTKKRRWL